MNTRSSVAIGMGLLALVGCRDDTTAPQEPATTSPESSVSTATALAFYQVSAGSYHSCGVTTDSRAYCWGLNNYGQVGDGTTYPYKLTPVAVVGGLHFKSVSAGGLHTCGVTTENQVYCWGYNGQGELGDGTTTDRSRPVAVHGGLKFAQVSAGGLQTCALTYPDRRAYCWGQNYQGVLGDGTTTNRLAPVAVRGARSYRQVSAGYAHTCAVTQTYEAYCWGWNRWYQLGDGTQTSRLSPVRVFGGYTFSQLSAGRSHTCAVTTDAQAYCWGRGREGQLGNGQTWERVRPRLVAGGLSFRRVTAGGWHTCGETPTSRAYCWGLNDQGQLGDGSFVNRATPAAVGGGLYFAQVSAGGSQHTCGKTPAAVAYCWGNNSDGQIGDGTTTWHPTPTRIAGTM